MHVVRRFLLSLCFLILPLSHAYSNVTQSEHFKVILDDENGVEHMNIIVVSASIDGIDLEVGDEIGVFSSGHCVGLAKLKQNADKLITIICSKDDGIGIGYYENDSIEFRLWDASIQKEYTVSNVSYFNMVPTWDTDGRFSGGETAFAEIESINTAQQIIHLKSGMNLISTYLVPEGVSFSDMFTASVQQGIAVKVFDEQTTMIYSSQNQAGEHAVNINPQKGYAVWVSDDCNVALTGYRREAPQELTFNQGINYLMYPFSEPCDALLFFDELIHQGHLIKVQDERGNAIFFDNDVNDWVNEIKVLQPGKSYVVIVNTESQYAISEYQVWLDPDSNYSEKRLGHYQPITKGNGFSHMQLELMGIDNLGMQADDEIGVFDIDVCGERLKVVLWHEMFYLF